MICECGGIYEVVKIHGSIHEDRLCDVRCMVCGKILYSQPYDFKSLNIEGEKDDTKDSE